jgi:hypothetical protein
MLVRIHQYATSAAHLVTSQGTVRVETGGVLLELEIHSSLGDNLEVIGIRLLIPMLRGSRLKDSSRKDMGPKDTKERGHLDSRDKPNLALGDGVARGLVLGDGVAKGLVMGDMEDSVVLPRETTGAKDATLAKRHPESMLYKRRRTTGSISRLLIPTPNFLH